MRTMRLVVLAVPHADEDAADEAFAVECMRACLADGDLPMTSHLLYVGQPIMRDANAMERILGQTSPRPVVDAAVVYVDRGVTDRMVQTVTHSFVQSRPIVWRALHGDVTAHLATIREARRRAGIVGQLEAFIDG